MTSGAFGSDSEFVVLDPGFQARRVTFTPELFAELDARFDAFRGHLLIAAFHFDGDWPTWEVHPAGDEVVVLLEGEITLVLSTPKGESAVHLDRPGRSLVIPRGTWHTGRTRTGAHMLFITPGEGTRNADEPGATASGSSRG